MNDEKRIILPGDPGWTRPQDEPTPYAPKIPSDVLEAAFTEAVTEVKEKLDEQKAPILDPNAVVIPEKKPHDPYRFHNPAQKKSIVIPVPKPMEAELLVNLPRKWEKVCYRKFRKGDKITLTDMLFTPGVGAVYGFTEGSRGGYAVSPDQVRFELPVASETVARVEEKLEVDPSMSQKESIE